MIESTNVSALSSYRYTLAAPTLPSSLLSIKVLDTINLPFGLIQLRRFDWQKPVNTVIVNDADTFLINYAISKRSADSNIHFIENPVSMPLDTLSRLFVLPPESVIQINAPHGTLQSLDFCIDVQKLDPTLRPGAGWKKSLFRQPMMKLSTKVETIIGGIYQEFLAHKPGRQAAIEALSHLLWLEMYRWFQEGITREPSVTKGGLSPWQLKAIHERVNENWRRPSIEELADLCGISTRHLSRAFLASTGETVRSFIDKTFIRNARTLLAEDRLTLEDIAQRLGYACANSCSNAYKRITGSSPRQAR